MINLEKAVGAVVTKIATHLQIVKAESIDEMLYEMPDIKGLSNASVPLTRRERRALKRKKK